MNFTFDTSLSETYTSKSQKIRVMSEAWTGENLFCPACRFLKINHFSNNKAVADFYCSNCHEEYELKSKNGFPRTKIVDGQFDTMISRLKSLTNPNLFFLNYDSLYEVKDFIVIPKYFFTPEIIESRKPLSLNAKRAGWVGCNILFSSIPKVGIISIIKDGVEISPVSISNLWKKTTFLKNTSLDVRGWTLDVLKIVQKIGKNDFTLDEVYQFESVLQSKYPKNRFVKDKIRQQLQILRDNNFLQFIERGRYLLN